MNLHIFLDHEKQNKNSTRLKIW